MYKGMAVQFYNMFKEGTQDTEMLIKCLNKMHNDGFDLKEILEGGVTDFERGLIESILLRKPEEKEFINSTQFAEMLGISKQAFHDRYKRSLNPNSRSGFPKPKHSQDGKNPLFDYVEAQQYVNTEKEKIPRQP